MKFSVGQPLSARSLMILAMGTPPFYFGHRQPPPKRSESPFEKFTVRCGKCQCERLRAVSDMDDASGELVIYLVCPCGQREKIPVR